MEGSDHHYLSSSWLRRLQGPDKNCFNVFITPNYSVLDTPSYRRSGANWIHLLSINVKLIWSVSFWFGCHQASWVRWDWSIPILDQSTSVRMACISIRNLSNCLMHDVEPIFDAHWHITEEGYFYFWILDLVFFTFNRIVLNTSFPNEMY